MYTLLCMIFLHIVDDYYLQGVLASMKQQNYWLKLPNYCEKYRFDYIAALIAHAFSWAFMIMLPIAFCHSFELSAVFYLVFVWNVFTHAFVDDLKANKFKINLVQDQLAHLLQIVVTFAVLV